MATRRGPVRTAADERSRDEPQASERRRGARESTTQRRAPEAQVRGRRSTREKRPQRSVPHTSPMPRLTEGPARPKNAAQAKARSKARKAKAPKVVRLPMRQRLLIKLSSIDLDPRRVVTRVPFVVLVIGALGVGLGVTLWLSTDAAERSYQLGHARQLNEALAQQKEGLERDVLEAQAAPALAEAARELGMIPSRDTAHLVQDPAGNWMVVGTPRPAEGVPPPPLNSPLPDPAPPAPPAAPAPRVVEPREVAVHIPPRPAPLPTAELATPPVTLAAPPAAGASPLPAPVPGAPVPAEVPAPLDAAAPQPLAAPIPVHGVPTLPGPPPGDDLQVPPAPAPAPAPVPGAPA